MEEKKLGEAGFRTAFEYYDRLEAAYRKLADEMHQEKMKVLTEWKQSNKGELDAYTEGDKRNVAE